jgi:hypothetical protein
MNTMERMSSLICYTVIEKIMVQKSPFLDFSKSIYDIFQKL